MFEVNLMWKYLIGAVLAFAVLGRPALADVPTACAWPNCPASPQGLKSHGEPVSVTLQSCSSAGVCPNSRGAFVIDTSIAWASCPGGRRDDDGSMWSSATANASTDFAAYYTAHTFGGATTQWNRSLSGPTHPGDGTGFPNAVCRETGSPFGACGNNLPSACSPTITSASPDLAIIYDASEDDYWPITLASYTGCAATTTSITTSNGIPVATTTSDQIELAVPDGVHGDTFYHRWLSQVVLNASEEFAFYPAVNPISNGGAETACNTLGWAVNGTGTLAGVTLDVTAGVGANNAVRGTGCQITGRTAGSGLDTASFAVTPGRIYVAKGYLRINSTTELAVVSVIDQGGTALNTSEVDAWHVLGASPIALASETSAAAECYNWCYVVIKFRAGASQTTAKVRISGASTANINADEWFAFPAPTQNMELNPLIRDGLASMRVVSDSRSDGQTGNEFGVAFDSMRASTRPNLALTAPLASRQDATSGRKLSDIVSESYRTIRGTVSDYTLLYIGLNDAVQDRTPAQYAADVLSTVREIRKVGSIPVVIIDSPYRGDTTSNICGTGGTTNCAITLADYARLVTQDPDLY